MENNQGVIIIKIDGEKIQSEKLKNSQVSILITQLDLLRQKLLDEYGKRIKFRMETK